jgi:hypothetical protein
MYVDPKYRELKYDLDLNTENILLSLDTSQELVKAAIGVKNFKVLDDDAFEKKVVKKTPEIKFKYEIS